MFENVISATYRSKYLFFQENNIVSFPKFVLQNTHSQCVLASSKMQATCKQENGHYFFIFFVCDLLFD